MGEDFSWKKLLLRTVSYILVAAMASVATMAVFAGKLLQGGSKLTQLKSIILTQFIGDVDVIAMEDAAAEGMVAALGDPWSYYIPASEYAAHVEQMNNSYVGIGVTITPLADGSGFTVTLVEEGSGALDAGVLPGDVIVAVEGQRIAQLGTEGAKALIRGEEGSVVSLTILRDGKEREFSLTRKTIQVQVASGQLLDGDIGLVRIKNFDSRCAAETKTAISQLLDQGAKALIFDVRNNPGGFKTELVELLDHLLPEGVLFQSRMYTGAESADSSDEACLELPMAVLINGQSYSAAEFFAAALEEYDWAVTVGEKTVGKGYFQQTIQLSDGSAVGLSVGKYFTPKGVSLADAGGLSPRIPVPVDAETAAMIYAGLLAPEEDPQIQAACDALTEKMAAAA